MWTEIFVGSFGGRAAVAERGLITVEISGRTCTAKFSRHLAGEKRLTRGDAHRRSAGNFVTRHSSRMYESAPLEHRAGGRSYPATWLAEPPHILRTSSGRLIRAYGQRPDIKSDESSGHHVEVGDSPFNRTSWTESRLTSPSSRYPDCKIAVRDMRVMRLYWAVIVTS